MFPFCFHDKAYWKWCKNHPEPFFMDCGSFIHQKRELFSNMVNCTRTQCACWSHERDWDCVQRGQTFSEASNDLVPHICFPCLQGIYVDLDKQTPTEIVALFDQPPQTTKQVQQQTTKNKPHKSMIDVDLSHDTEEEEEEDIDIDIGGDKDHHPPHCSQPTQSSSNNAWTLTHMVSHYDAPTEPKSFPPLFSASKRVSTDSAPLISLADWQTQARDLIKKSDHRHFHLYEEESFKARDGKNLLNTKDTPSNPGGISALRGDRKHGFIVVNSWQQADGRIVIHKYKWHDMNNHFKGWVRTEMEKENVDFKKYKQCVFGRTSAWNTPTSIAADNNFELIKKPELKRRRKSTCSSGNDECKMEVETQGLTPHAPHLVSETEDVNTAASWQTNVEEFRAKKGGNKAIKYDDFRVSNFNASAIPWQEHELAKRFNAQHFISGMSRLQNLEICSTTDVGLQHMIDLYKECENARGATAGAERYKQCEYKFGTYKIEPEIWNILTTAMVIAAKCYFMIRLTAANVIQYRTNSSMQSKVGRLVKYLAMIHGRDQIPALSPKTVAKMFKILEEEASVPRDSFAWKQNSLFATEMMRLRGGGDNYSTGFGDREQLAFQSTLKHYKLNQKSTSKTNQMVKALDTVISPVKDLIQLEKERYQNEKLKEQSQQSKENPREAKANRKENSLADLSVMLYNYNHIYKGECREIGDIVNSFGNDDKKDLIVTRYDALKSQERSPSVILGVLNKMCKAWNT
eukprot:117734_1